MERYSRLTQKEIDDLLAKFGVSQVSSFKLLDGGQENTNYLITSNPGKYVLSICEQKSFENATELAQLLNHLNENGFKTSKVVTNRTSELVDSYNGKPVMLKIFIEGKIVEDLTPELLVKIGEELGKLHKVEAPAYLPTQLGYGVEQFKSVKEYAPESSFDKWLEGIEKMITPFFKLDLPKSIIHSDLFWDNVIVSEKEDNVTIMDFEEATIYYRVFDMGMAIIGLCAEEDIINLTKASHLLKGYQQELQLTGKEIDSLKAFTIYAGAAMSFWRHQNFNHVKPDPKKFDHYQGLKVLADYMSEQDDDCFKKMSAFG